MKKINTNYHLMCTEAKELQESWQPQMRDFIKIKNLKTIQTIAQIDNETVYCESHQAYNLKQCIWLPSKVQLEEYLNEWGMMRRFYEYIHKTWDNYLKKVKSEEELLISFIMWHFHNKIWNIKEKKWILQK